METETKTGQCGVWLAGFIKSGVFFYTALKLKSGGAENQFPVGWPAVVWVGQLRFKSANVDLRDKTVNERVILLSVGNQPSFGR